MRREPLPPQVTSEVPASGCTRITFSDHLIEDNVGDIMTAVKVLKEELRKLNVVCCFNGL